MGWPGAAGVEEWPGAVGVDGVARGCGCRWSGGLELWV